MVLGRHKYIRKDEIQESRRRRRRFQILVLQSGPEFISELTL